MNISGGRHTSHNFVYWPGNIHLDKKMIEKCNTSINDAVNSIPLDILGLFPDQNAGFYSYGADIMLDSTGHAWILEMNMNPDALGAAKKLIDVDPLVKKQFDNYLQKLYNFHLDNIVIPYFITNTN